MKTLDLTTVCTGETFTFRLGHKLLMMGDIPVDHFWLPLPSLRPTIRTGDRSQFADVLQVYWRPSRSSRGAASYRTPTPPVALIDAATLKEMLAVSPRRVAKLSGLVHRLARTVLAQGGDWRAVIDALRPFTADLWKSLPPRERLRFLQRIKPFWEVLRHRMAPQIAERLNALFAAGTLRRVSATITQALGATNRVVLDLVPKGGSAAHPHAFDWVVNCTGPAPSNSAEANPVVGSLLVHGWVSRDEFFLGLNADTVGHAIATDGDIVPDLFIVDTLRKLLL